MRVLIQTKPLMSQCAMFSMPCVWTYLILAREVDCTMKTSTNVGQKKKQLHVCRRWKAGFDCRRDKSLK